MIREGAYESSGDPSAGEKPGAKLYFLRHERVPLRAELQPTPKYGAGDGDQAEHRLLPLLPDPYGTSQALLYGAAGDAPVRPDRAGRTSFRPRWPAWQTPWDFQAR